MNIGQADLQHEPTDPGMAEADHAAHEKTPATDNAQLGSCGSLRVDAHHITSVLSVLS